MNKVVGHIRPEDVEAILDELYLLAKGLSRALRRMVDQEAEINVLHSILEQKGLVTWSELNQACGSLVERSHWSCQRRCKNPRSAG
jgi:hypothetical protein